jgi:hypothetical protein
MSSADFCGDIRPDTMRADGDGITLDVIDSSGHTDTKFYKAL